MTTRPTEKLTKGHTVDNTISHVSVFLPRTVGEREKLGGTALFLSALAGIAYYKRAELLAAAEYQSSPVDWCEANYVVHSHVAEFWNSLSSCFMVLVGLAGPFFYTCDGVHKAEPQINLLWALMVFVGIGSVLFHSTLSVMGQVLDELPIVALILYSIASFRPRHRWGSSAVRDLMFNQYFLFCLLSAATLVCVLNPLVCHVITCAMLPGGTYLYFREYWAASREESPYVKRAKQVTGRVFAVALLNFGGALTAWVVDRMYCDQIHGAFVPVVGYYPQLHALWHILMTNCFWGCLCTGLANRFAGERHTVEIEYDRVTSIIPFVRIV